MNPRTYSELFQQADMQVAFAGQAMCRPFLYYRPTDPGIYKAADKICNPRVREIGSSLDHQVLEGGCIAANSSCNCEPNIHESENVVTRSHCHLQVSD
jgi:hypothetical protein